jgi:tetratricopeptide (TPR) repeat protein
LTFANKLSTISSNAFQVTEMLPFRMEPLKSQAIHTALTGDWNSAVSLNQTILQDFPDDIDTLNRLAFAYTSIGNSKEAKSLYQKVLLLDAQNPIALRNLKRLSGGSASGNYSMQMNNIFIEEPGKTKVIELINVAEKKLLGKLRAGEHVMLQVKRMKIFVLDGEKQYLGMLPDDIGRRLIEFINGGNEYEAYVKTIDNLRLIIFIKETKRSTRFKNQPSFPSFDKSRFSLESHGANGKHGRSFKPDHDDDSGETTDEESS